MDSWLIRNDNKNMSKKMTRLSHEVAKLDDQYALIAELGRQPNKWLDKRARRLGHKCHLAWHSVLPGWYYGSNARALRLAARMRQKYYLLG